MVRAFLFGVFGSAHANCRPVSKRHIQESDLPCLHVLGYLYRDISIPFAILLSNAVWFRIEKSLISLILANDSAAATRRNNTYAHHILIFTCIVLDLQTSHL